MPKINHQILVWACRQASLSPDEACSALKLSDGKKETALEKLAGYETGVKEPSRAMLREMARSRGFIGKYSGGYPFKSEALFRM
jgi:hypothetical protein